MSAVNPSSRDKPHRALIVLWFVAAPIAIVSHLHHGTESPSKYWFDVSVCVSFVLCSGLLLRMHPVMRVRKPEVREDIAERDRVISASMAGGFGWLMIIAVVVRLVTAIVMAARGNEENWLEMTREASASAVMAVFLFNFARVFWPSKTAEPKLSGQSEDNDAR